MAVLPDPTDRLAGADREAFDRMASARAYVDGRPQLGQVYVRMFNNPALAAKVGALGEQLRFRGVLPDSVRELAILRYASRRRLGYEWSHHQRPARLAGLTEEVIAAVTRGEAPSALPEASRAALLAVDAVAEFRSIPDGAQQQLVAAYGTAGVVELVALCGLYGFIGGMATAFDVQLEDGMPPPPF